MTATTPTTDRRLIVDTLDDELMVCTAVLLWWPLLLFPLVVERQLNENPFQRSPKCSPRIFLEQTGFHWMSSWRNRKVNSPLKWKVFSGKGKESKRRQSFPLRPVQQTLLLLPNSYNTGSATWFSYFSCRWILLIALWLCVSVTGSDGGAEERRPSLCYGRAFVRLPDADGSWAEWVNAGDKNRANSGVSSWFGFFVQLYDLPLLLRSTGSVISFVGAAAAFGRPDWIAAAAARLSPSVQRERVIQSLGHCVYRGCRRQFGKVFAGELLYNSLVHPGLPQNNLWTTWQHTHQTTRTTAEEESSADKIYSVLFTFFKQTVKVKV